jgi:DNA-binding response OmpR family regulator
MQPTTRSMHALLVEDSLIFAEALRLLLMEARTDIRLSHVTRLFDARGFRDAQIDVILLDLSLPDADGIESVRSAMSMLPGVPIVVLTAERDSEHAFEVVREGAQDYLVKGAFDADTPPSSARKVRCSAPACCKPIACPPSDGSPRASRTK